MSQPEVLFYVLPSSEEDKVVTFVQKLLIKAIKNKVPSELLFGDDVAQLRWDQALWCGHFFIPHLLAEDEKAPLSPVILSQKITENRPYLLNLASVETLADQAWLNKTRIMEIIDQTPQRLQEGRAKYKFYKQHHIEPITHKL